MTMYQILSTGVSQFAQEELKYLVKTGYSLFYGDNGVKPHGLQMQANITINNTSMSFRKVQTQISHFVETDQQLFLAMSISI